MNLTRLAVFGGVAGVLLAAVPAASAASHIASTASAREFLAGEAKGTSVTADGRLTLGEPLDTRAWPEDASDAVVFAAASDASGNVYVATGGGLGRLFVSRPDGKVSLLFTAAEPNLTAVAVAPDGGVVCGSSPNGKIYRVDPKERSAENAGRVVGEPKEAAIWSLAFGPDGTLYAGTGNKGRIYRRRKDGSLDLFREIEDVHVRSLAVGADGTLYAGTSDRGLLVAIAPDGGSLRTLHDFARPEVVGIVVRKDGTIFAAASSAEGAPGAGAPLDVKRAPSPVATPAPKESDETPKGSVSVSTGPARFAPTAGPSREGSGEVVQIGADGFVEPAWIFPDETIFSIRYDEKAGTLVLTTGSKGRVYRWKDRHVTLEAQTNEKQVVAAPPVGSSFAAVTMNAAGVLRPATKGTHVGTFVSAVKDAVRASRFGRLHSEGATPAGTSVRFFVRVGNAEKPDDSWSAWAPLDASGDPKPEGKPLPIGRFFQWKAELSPGPKGEAPSLERVEFTYAERNARPYLENVSVLEPGAVFPKSGASATTVLSVTNPDEAGIYSGLESPREPGGEAPGKKLYRKGFRTVVWKGSDPNGDALRYEVEARREGTSAWFPVRRDLEDAFYSFDTTSLPDGRYRFRVSASDRVSNPEGDALTASEETPIAVVDNTPPQLAVASARVAGAELELAVEANDALSPIAKGEGSVNADRWRLLVPDDGAAGGKRARFTLRVPKPSGPAVLSIRVVDAAGNVASVAAEYPSAFK